MPKEKSNDSKGPRIEASKVKGERDLVWQRFKKGTEEYCLSVLCTWGLHINTNKIKTKQSRIFQSHSKKQNKPPPQTLLKECLSLGG